MSAKIKVIPGTFGKSMKLLVERKRPQSLAKNALLRINAFNGL